MPRRNDREPSLREWLGFKDSLKLSEAPFGKFIGCILIGIVITTISILSISFLFILFQFLIAVFPKHLLLDTPSPNDGVHIAKLATLILTFLGVPFIIWRTMIAAKQADTAQESLLNDKINEAMNQLNARYEVSERVGSGGNTKVVNEWKDDITARISAIDRLEGVVFEDNELAPRVVMILSAYIRLNFPIKNPPQITLPHPRKIPRADLQAAITTIGKILSIARTVDNNHWFLDLSRCDFNGVNFFNHDYFATDFSSSTFETSRFDQTQFTGCNFSHSIFNFTDFRFSNFTGAKFVGTIFINQQLDRINFFKSCLTGAVFVRVNLGGLNPKHETFINGMKKAFATNDTTFPEALNTILPSSSEKENYDQLAQSSKSPNQDGIHFPYFSSYNVNQTHYMSLLKQMLIDNDMHNWPYWVVSSKDEIP